MSLSPYLLGGAFMWFCMLPLGHSRLDRRRVLAFAIPFSRARPDDGIALAPARARAAQAGRVSDPAAVRAGEHRRADRCRLRSRSWRHANSLGIALGLLIGKPLGIVLMCAPGGGLGVCSLPGDLRWSHMRRRGIARRHRLHDVDLHHQPGVRGSPQAIVNSSKLAVLLASLVAGAAGARVAADDVPWKKYFRTLGLDRYQRTQRDDRHSDNGPRLIACDDIHEIAGEIHSEQEYRRAISPPLPRHQTERGSGASQANGAEQWICRTSHAQKCVVTSRIDAPDRVECPARRYERNECETTANTPNRNSMQVR